MSNINLKSVNRLSNWIRDNIFNSYDRYRDYRFECKPNGSNPGYDYSEDENEENSSINIDGPSKTTNHTTIGGLPLAKDVPNDKEKVPDKIPEREIDDIVDLKEKFKSILMKINVEDGEDCLIYGMQANLLTEKHKIKQGIIYSNDERVLTFINPVSKKNQICC